MSNAFNIKMSPLLLSSISKLLSFITLKPNHPNTRDPKLFNLDFRIKFILVPPLLTPRSSVVTHTPSILFKLRITFIVPIVYLLYNFSHFSNFIYS